MRKCTDKEKNECECEELGCEGCFFYVPVPRADSIEEAVKRITENRINLKKEIKK